MLPIESAELQAEIGREIYSHLKNILAWLDMIAPEERKAVISQRTDSSVHLQARKMGTRFQLRQTSQAARILTAQMNWPGIFTHAGRLVTVVVGRCSSASAAEYVVDNLTKLKTSI